MQTIKTAQELKEILKNYPHFTISIMGDFQTPNVKENLAVELYKEDGSPMDTQSYLLSEFIGTDNLMIHLYSNSFSLELDLNLNLGNLDLSEGNDGQYFDYNPDTLNAILLSIVNLGKQAEYYPRILNLLSNYQLVLEQEDEWEEIEYYGYLLEQREKLYEKSYAEIVNKLLTSKSDQITLTSQLTMVLGSGQKENQVFSLLTELNNLNITPLILRALEEANKYLTTTQIKPNCPLNFYTLDDLREDLKKYFERVYLEHNVKLIES